MKLRKLFVAMLLCAVTSAWAQYTIHGIVSDSENGKGLEGATISSNGTTRGTITDELGQYSIELPKGIERITVQHLGYKSKEVALSASGEVNVQLIAGEFLEEVVIQSVRADDKAPVTHTTLRKKDIQKIYKGEHPIYFLQSLTPGILTESESGTSFGNYGTMRLRGLEQKRINFTLNGVPLNDMIDHGVYFSNFSDISNSFESVQVQRGVGTTSAGAASYGGSVNFETLNLERTRAGSRIQLGYGSYNSARASGQFNSGLLDNNWAFHGSFSKLHSDGYKDNTESDAYSFFFSAAYIGEKNIFKINAFDARSKNGLGYEAVDLATIHDDPKFNPLNENDKDDFGQQFVQIQHVRSYTPNFKLVGSLYYNGAGGDFLYGWVGEDGGLTQINYPLSNKHYGYMEQLHVTLTEGMNLSSGIHLYTFRRNNQEQLSPDFANPYYNEKSQKDEVSVFAKLRYDVGNLIVQAEADVRNTRLTIKPDFEAIGIATDEDLREEWLFFNPKFGLAYDISTSMQVYASAGKTSREPTKVDILAGWSLDDSATYMNLKSGIDFAHEEVIDIEAGLRFSGNALSTEVNGFYMKFTDGILPTGETIEFGSQVRTNIPDSYRIGVEVLGQYKPVDWVALTTNATYLHSSIAELRFTSDSVTLNSSKPAYSPELIANAEVAVQVMPGLEVALSGRYVSESYMTLRNEPKYILPAHFLLNGRIHVQFLKKHSFAFELNNITSEEYFTNGKALDMDWDGVPDGVPGYLANAPLNFFGTLTFNFD